VRQRATAFFLCLAAVAAPGARAAEEAARLSAALQGDTPLASDLRALTDGIGGRATGSEANRKSVQWALARLREAGLQARAEPFTMPRLWLERSSSATVSGDAAFAARVVAMPFSAAGRFSAPLVDGGFGSEADFARLGGTARGAFVLLETHPLLDLAGLFREYAESAAIDARARAAGALGVVTQSSRPRGLLYRHNAPQGDKNARPMLIMDREAAARALRLLREGRRLALGAEIDVQEGGAYTAENVVGDIPGSDRPEEVVLLGAHLDAWELGTGALDNGCNVALLIDVARQIKALGLKPRRTLRFVLWNGEEQGLMGSWAYVRDHAAELDRHRMAASFDIGSGAITGFFTGGRGAEMKPALDAALAPVAALGPFTHVDEPVVGTDNYDFMMEGVPNLVAVQADATYGPDYHASSDTFDKVDVPQVKRNAAVVAALAWALAQDEAAWPRHTAAQVTALVETTSLKDQMVSFGVMEDWKAGRRGRRAPR
jgi:Iap family predicted aminopeptidase